MVRPFPTHATIDNNVQCGSLAIGLFISVFALVALCAKRSAINSPKSPNNNNNNNHHNDLFDLKTPIDQSPANNNNVYNKVSRSAMSTPKRLLSTLSNLSIKSNNNNKKNSNEANKEDEEMIDEAKDTLSEGGLWQKNILMGEKCQPLEYSGVIYYDINGQRTSEIPRSPRVSSVVNQGGFSIPVSSRLSSMDMDH